jgi:hypothetical protein
MGRHTRCHVKLVLKSTWCRFREFLAKFPTSGSKTEYKVSRSASMLTRSSDFFMTIASFNRQQSQSSVYEQKTKGRLVRSHKRRAGQWWSECQTSHNRKELLIVGANHLLALSGFLSKSFNRLVQLSEACCFIISVGILRTRSIVKLSLYCFPVHLLTARRFPPLRG